MKRMENLMDGLIDVRARFFFFMSHTCIFISPPSFLPYDGPVVSTHARIGRIRGNENQGI